MPMLRPMALYLMGVLNWSDRWFRPDGPIRAAPRANAVVAAHLSAALGQLSDDQPALAAAIAAAAPHLAWTTYTEYPAAEVGPNFARSHAYASLIGVEQASTITCQALYGC